MVELTRAHKELYRRTPDERFASLPDLLQHCQQQKALSVDCWQQPQSLRPRVNDHNISVCLNGEQPYRLNEWSFTQLCRLSGINKETVNRLSPETGRQVFSETLPAADKPIQLLTMDENVRSLHGVAYTRLWNADLLEVVANTATHFEPPQEGVEGATGLYCGEQDMFAFLIDPTGWIEIDDESFAPGFFVWNSEVGRRSLGIQSFWFQSICQNHIVWDAVEVCEFTRKHTARVQEGLNEIEHIIERLVAKRDARRDQFAQVIRKAMVETLGTEADEVAKELVRHGIPRGLAGKAIEIAQEQGPFSIFSIVQALTQLSQKTRFVGDRTDSDQKIAGLLTLVS